MTDTCASPSALSRRCSLIPPPIIIIDSDSNGKLDAVEQSGTSQTIEGDGMKAKAQKDQHLTPPRVPLGKITMQPVCLACLLISVELIAVQACYKRSFPSDIVLLDHIPVYLETYPDEYLAPRSRKVPKAASRTPCGPIVSPFQLRTPNTPSSNFLIPSSLCSSESCLSSSSSIFPSPISIDEIESAPIFFTCYPSVSDEEEVDLSMLPVPSFAMSMMGGVMEMAEEFVPPRRRDVTGQRPSHCAAPSRGMCHSRVHVGS